MGLLYCITHRVSHQKERDLCYCRKYFPILVQSRTLRQTSYPAMKNTSEANYAC